MFSMLIVGLFILLICGCLGPEKEPPTLDDLYPIVMMEDFNKELRLDFHDGGEHENEI